MVFSTLIFLFAFFPIFFGLYYLTPDRYKNYLALVLSVLFYFWGAPTFVFFVFFSLIIDWHLGNCIYTAETKAQKKYFLVLALIMNVSLLAYFKYANFFVENLEAMLRLLHFSTAIPWTKVILPIGVSFIVFEKITYNVDIYRSLTKPAERLNYYLLYIFIFPHLIAGPIIQYHDIAKRLVKRKHNYINFRYGLYRFAMGLAKKVWLADTVGNFADKVFGIPTHALSTPNAWLGIVCYALQIYFDFSGYADMAIGMLRMMGFKIKENFNLPYISQSFTEFWRRWHISLSSWMRNYLYIPLGGNRVSQGRMYFNLLLVFFISGFWHGANWTFIIWGLFNGFFLLTDKMFWLKTSARLPKAFNVLLTFFLVCIGWVFFRSADLSSAWLYLQKLFALHAPGMDPANFLATPKSFILILGTALVLTFLPTTRWFWAWWERVKFRFNRHYYQEAVTLVLVLFSVLKMSNAAFSPFIYFRF